MQINIFFITKIDAFTNTAVNARDKRFSQSVKVFLKDILNKPAALRLETTGLQFQPIATLRKLYDSSSATEMSVKCLLHRSF